MKRRRFAFSTAAIAVVAFTSLAHSHAAEPARKKPAPARVAQPAKAAPLQADVLAREVREITSKTGDAVCRIEADDEHGRLRGTGFFIDADGTLLTTYSVGGTSQDITVTVGEQRYPATRVIADGDGDVL